MGMPGPHSFTSQLLRSVSKQCGRLHWQFTWLKLSLKETLLGVLKEDASALSASRRLWPSMWRGTMTQLGTTAQNARTLSRLGSTTNVSPGPRLAYFQLIFCRISDLFIFNICVNVQWAHAVYGQCVQVKMHMLYDCLYYYIWMSIIGMIVCICITTFGCPLSGWFMSIISMNNIWMIKIYVCLSLMFSVISVHICCTQYTVQGYSGTLFHHLHQWIWIIKWPSYLNI